MTTTMRGRRGGGCAHWRTCRVGVGIVVDTRGEKESGVRASLQRMRLCFFAAAELRCARQRSHVTTRDALLRLSHCRQEEGVSRLHHEHRTLSCAMFTSSSHDSYTLQSTRYTYNFKRRSDRQRTVDSTTRFSQFAARAAARIVPPVTNTKGGV